MLRLICVAAIAALAACASNAESAARDEAPAHEASQGGEPVSAEPSPVPAAPIPSTSEGSAPPSEGGSAGGRMAFTQCNADDRPQACTREYRPVCAEVDNGVRCVTTPCDSTDQKELANGCTACADAKTIGYWPVACAQLGQDAK